MSLWCGNCRTEICYGCVGLGALYELKRTSEGKLRYADKAKDYVPANSAICGPCWDGLPTSEKHTGESAKTEAEQGNETVFVYAPNDGNHDAFWDSREDGDLVFVKPQAVARYFPKALEIIINGVPLR